MTTPLPDSVPASGAPRRTAAERDRARTKVARKWAYLVSKTTHVPLAADEFEHALLELVHVVLDAVAREPLALDDAAAVGTRLVELHCSDSKSLQRTVEVLFGAVVSDPDLGHLDRLPERAARIMAAVASGFVDAVRKRTIEHQDSLYRALMEVARTATRTAQARARELQEVNTELSLLRRQLGHQLLHDALTGLPNRQFFSTRLEEVLNSGSPTTVYRLELDGFPAIRDGVGQERGDTLLATTAVRLRAAIADEKAMVARFDSANFAILQEHPASTTDPSAIVREIGAALTEPAYVGDLGVATTASVGVVQSPPHPADPVELLHAADIALHHARSRGPGGWELLEPGGDAEARRLFRLVASMPGAWETGQLKVGYRLRVRLTDGAPAGVDAFVSWPEAEPGQCLDLAEQTGLSPRLGRWLLRSATEQFDAWHRTAGLAGAGIPLVVCLSRNQSRAPDLPDTVIEALDGAGLHARWLQVAMPAAVLAADDQAARNLTTLAEHGVRTSVHDFSGDLAALADLPLHEVRVSPSLVRGARERDRPKLMPGMVALLHLAGVEVAVDDLRTIQEADWWRQAQADIATGPLFSPHEAATIPALFPGS